MTGKGKGPTPHANDWWGFHKPPRRQKHICKIRKCKCGHLGCLSWWMDLSYPGYKVLRFMHAHFLKPTFEPRRNHNHVLRHTKKKYEPHEVRKTTKLINPNTIPDYVLAEFGL